MKKVLYTDFEDTGSIIEKMLQSTELKKVVSRNNLYKFWGKVVGEKLAQSSKPYGMRGGGVLVIACKSSIVAQELMLRKLKIINEMTPYMKSLHITIKDICFDCKKSNMLD